jgi:TrkA domain protein
VRLGVTMLGMTRIDETRLPGIGIRHDFVTATGTKIGVVTYRDGRRELVVFDERDPDECRAAVYLDEGDAHTLADLLGGSHIIEHVEHERKRPPE